MIDKDNIQELFSRSLENHTVSVRPEVWNGLQAKMAAAGVTSVVAAKGISALAKWIIGSAAVTGAAVVTTLVVMNSSEESQTTPPVKVETTTPSKGQDETTQTTSNKPDQTAQYTLPAVNEQLEQRSTTFFPRNTVAMMVKDPIDDQNDSKPAIQPMSVITQPMADPLESVVFMGLPEEDKNPTQQVVLQASQSENQSTFEKSVIVFPNVFTPLNQDSYEDEYYLIECKHVKSVEVSILNTENKEVYRSTDPAFHWNGRIFNEGDFVEAGTYACIVIYKDMAGKSHKSIQLVEIPKR